MKIQKSKAIVTWAGELPHIMIYVQIFQTGTACQTAWVLACYDDIAKYCIRTGV